MYSLHTSTRHDDGLGGPVKLPNAGSHPNKILDKEYLDRVYKEVRNKPFSVYTVSVMYHLCEYMYI